MRMLHLVQLQQLEPLPPLRLSSHATFPDVSSLSWQWCVVPQLAGATSASEKTKFRGCARWGETEEGGRDDTAAVKPSPQPPKADGLESRRSL